jgi:uncharacterized membrane protein SpoIIM required for sporulation
MVLEDLFNLGWVRHRPYLALIFGFFFTFVAFLLSYLFFRGSMSVAMIFLTTLLLIPTLIMLLRMEEQVERKYGLKHFFRNHKDIFEVYFFSFIGVFIAFMVLGLGVYDDTSAFNQLFDFQSRFLRFEQGVSSETVRSFVEGNVEQEIGGIIEVFSHNLMVLLICFVLSFLYGASAIFLIILNSSVFASFIVVVIKSISENASHGLQAFGFLMVHLLPEISGFLVAAIAGGVVSKAVLYERKGSKAFKNVFKDATVLMLIAVGLVLVSAVLEILVTARLFQAFF